MTLVGAPGAPPAAVLAQLTPRVASPQHDTTRPPTRDTGAAVPAMAQAHCRGDRGLAARKHLAPLRVPSPPLDKAAAQAGPHARSPDADDAASPCGLSLHIPQIGTAGGRSAGGAPLGRRSGRRVTTDPAGPITSAAVTGTTVANHGTVCQHNAYAAEAAALMARRAVEEAADRRT